MLRFDPDEILFCSPQKIPALKTTQLKARLSLNGSFPMATMTFLTRVKWFTKSVVVLLLALWVPVTMHCTLETMPGFSFLQWCCGGDEAPQSGQDCSQDSCGAVESGLYKTEDNHSFTSGLALLLELAAWEWVAEPPAEFASLVASVSSAPPELARFWQFSYRTALPPRAPSLVA